MTQDSPQVDPPTAAQAPAHTTSIYNKLNYIDLLYYDLLVYLKCSLCIGPGPRCRSNSQWSCDSSSIPKRHRPCSKNLATPQVPPMQAAARNSSRSPRLSQRRSPPVPKSMWSPLLASPAATDKLAHTKLLPSFSTAPAFSLGNSEAP